jgi:hypothetical protein
VATSASALPVGNPQDPELRCSGLFNLGFYGDYVFNRYLEIDETTSQKDIERGSLFTNSAFLAIDLWNHLEVFTAIGGTYFNIIEIERDTHFTWSIGVRTLLWKCGRVALGGEGSYFATAFADMKYREWQLGVGATYNVCEIAFPYAAVKIARCHASFGESFLPDLENSRFWGGAIGINFVICCNTTVGIEGRFGDEAACHLNGVVRF